MIWTCQHVTLCRFDRRKLCMWVAVYVTKQNYGALDVKWWLCCDIFATTFTNLNCQAHGKCFSCRRITPALFCIWCDEFWPFNCLLYIRHGMRAEYANPSADEYCFLSAVTDKFCFLLFPSSLALLKGMTRWICWHVIYGYIFSDGSVLSRIVLTKGGG